MIKAEEINGRIHHYSDAGFKLRQIETGVLYDDAVDVLPCKYTYEETDKLIPVEDASVEDKAEAYDILMGVSE